MSRFSRDRQGASVAPSAPPSPAAKHAAKHAATSIAKPGSSTPRRRLAGPELAVDPVPPPGLDAVERQHENRSRLGVHDPVFGNARRGVLGPLGHEVASAFGLGRPDDLDDEVRTLGLTVTVRDPARAEEHHVRRAIPVRSETHRQRSHEDFADPPRLDMPTRRTQQVDQQVAMLPSRVGKQFEAAVGKLDEPVPHPVQGEELGLVPAALKRIVVRDLPGRFAPARGNRRRVVVVRDGSRRGLGRRHRFVPSGRAASTGGVRRWRPMAAARIDRVSSGRCHRKRMSGRTAGRSARAASSVGKFSGLGCRFSPSTATTSKSVSPRGAAQTTASRNAGSVRASSKAASATRVASQSPWAS